MAGLRCRRPRWLWVLLLATAVATVPLPVLAADLIAPPPTPTPPRLGELARQAVMALPPAALAGSAASALWPVQAQTSAQASANVPEKAGGEKPTRWSFFKTPTGIAVMATVAVGLGYTLYSMQHDRVYSSRTP